MSENRINGIEKELAKNMRKIDDLDNDINKLFAQTQEIYKLLEATKKGIKIICIVKKWIKKNSKWMRLIGEIIGFIYILIQIVVSL